MVLKPAPMVAAIREAKKRLPNAKVIAMAPGGITFSQKIAEDLAIGGQDLIFVCGHYEGFDERIFNWVDAKISIGDYVLTGGELPALVIMDAVSRFIPGVLGKFASAVEDSFSTGLLEYPQYTRPEVFEGLAVPEVLKNGNHALINKVAQERGFKGYVAAKAGAFKEAELEPADAKLLAEVKAETQDNKNKK
jgi:tRNA (guanine37-N1)-methyltransferase